MGVYVGKIEIRGIFFNFTPLYECIGDELIQLTESDYGTLLPLSLKKNINLWYNTHYDTQFMDDTFYEDTPIIVEFETEDLKPNYNKQNELKDTGYIMSAREEWEAGKIRYVSDIGMYRLLNADEFNGDLKTSTRIELNTEALMAGTDVFLWSSDEKVYVGPYELTYRENDQTFVALSNFKENKYILSGYSSVALQILTLKTTYGDYSYAKPNPAAQPKYFDIINDSVLLESFRDSVNNKLVRNGTVDLSNTEELVASFKNSAFFLNIPDESISQNRLYRVTELLNRLNNVDDALKFISETMSSTLGSLLKKYEGTEDAENLINAILTENPDLMNQVQGYRIIKDRVAALETKKETLSVEIEVLKEQIEDLKLAESDVIAEKKITDANAAVNELEESKDKIQKEIDALKEKLQKLHNLSDLDSEIEEQNNKTKLYELRKDELKRETDQLSIKLAEATASIEAKLAEIHIDGLVANQLQQASSQWEKMQYEEKYRTRVSYYEELNAKNKKPDELVEYLYSIIHEVRPQYDKNTIININACIFNNFLTVFSGDPGCGKTSICNILGQAYGLKNYQSPIDEDYSRYISVSVERGWTSKRDFIGYYNPLTKSFDQNNKKMFEALNVLDIEAKHGITKYPMLVLLDEANLSPMEYYWADFMNVCDDIDISNEINIGGDNVFKVPETLHFVATINNDHTTETLSPRLIDRAAVITLPRVTDATYSSLNLNEAKIENISWSSIKEAFSPSIDVIPELGVESNNIYKIIKAHLKNKNIYLSPRTEISIKKYCGITSKLFESSSDQLRRSPEIIALDYAIAQKVLPKVSGYGDQFRSWLVDFREKCNNHMLLFSHDIIEEMLNKGDANMNYYQFFA